mgnify:CR=1 FL=1
MPRKGEVPKRKLLPDPKFTDQMMDTRTVLKSTSENGVAGFAR